MPSLGQPIRGSFPSDDPLYDGRFRVYLFVNDLETIRNNRIDWPRVHSAQDPSSS